jgi:hypothetical protein
LLAQDPHDTHQRSAAKISVGKFDSAQTFTQGSDPPNQVKALPLIDIGTNVCSRLLFLPPSCTAYHSPAAA